MCFFLRLDLKKGAMPYVKVIIFLRGLKPFLLLGIASTEVKKQSSLWSSSLQEHGLLGRPLTLCRAWVPPHSVTHTEPEGLPWKHTEPETQFPGVWQLLLCHLFLLAPWYPMLPLFPSMDRRLGDLHSQAPVLEMVQTKRWSTYQIGTNAFKTYNIQTFFLS